MTRRDEIALFDRSHRESRELVAGGAPVYVFVDPQEYHGPHLPLHNDALVATGLARELHLRLAEETGWPLLRARDLGVGCGVVPGPGSRSTPFRRVGRIVREACDALVELGARRAVLMTFHGDPLHNLAIESGVRRLRARGIAALAPMHHLLRQMMSPAAAILDEALAFIEDPATRRAEREVIGVDLHAGFLETSLTLHFAPGAVSPRYRELPPCPRFAPRPDIAWLARTAMALGREALGIELDYAARGLAWFRVRPFPGYTGSPHLARPEVGALLARLIADGYAGLARAVLLEGAAPPEPVMPWLVPLTLGGRLPV